MLTLHCAGGFLDIFVRAFVLVLIARYHYDQINSENPGYYYLWERGDADSDNDAGGHGAKY